VEETVTMQLACALRELGTGLILDADLNGPRRRAWEVCRTRSWFGERERRPHHRSGIGVVSIGTLFPEPRAIEFESVASGSSHTWRAIKEFTVRGRSWRARLGSLDYLLVDFHPARSGSCSTRAAGPRALFVLVAIPRICEGVVARSIDALEKTHRIWIRRDMGLLLRRLRAVGPLFPGSRASRSIFPASGAAFDPSWPRLRPRRLPVRLARAIFWSPVRGCSRDLPSVAEPASAREERV